jgi:hypothetical protein
MQKTDAIAGFVLPRWTTTLLLTVVAGILLSASTVSAQTYYALEYFGGPVLETFTIYPLYYGDWSPADIETQQNYLKSLAAYISGKKAPAGQQPVIRQYGVMSASVATHVKYAAQTSPQILNRTQLVSIITTNQLSGKLPAFGPTTVIALFLAHGFQTDDCDHCAYHASITNVLSPSSLEIWLVVPQDTGSFQLATAHEVFEAATDPVVDDPTHQAWGWLTGAYHPQGSSSLQNDEMVDECGIAGTAIGTITLNNLGIQIPAVMDNTGGVFLGNPAKTQPPTGTCSTTGYTSLDEIQIYGRTFSQYKAKYDSLWPQGWRLYILQSYIATDGTLLYNAVWRPAGNTDEIQQYQATIADFKAKYNTLYPLGWRIHILDSYVQDGTVRFNAVWRPGDVNETQKYEDSAAQFQTDFKTFEPEGWRLYLLQSYAVGSVANLSGIDFNAVWRSGVTGETLLTELQYSNYRADYDSLWNRGWRLYLLQAYLAPGGTLLYNSVFHQGNHGEIQIYGATYATNRAEYDT